ncbi:MAG: RNA polymerase sigma factor, partial [Planctomycetota bacterium]
MKDTTLSHQQLKELGEGQAWARRLAETLLGDAHLAEDAVQDAWLVALETQPNLRSPGRWLGGAVRNLALGEVRSRARRRRRESEAAAREALPSTSEAASKLEAQELLIRAVLRLDEPFRSTVLARYVEGLPQRRIAARDGVPVSTVNSRLTRGLQRLRASLGDEHGEDSALWMSALIPLVAKPAAPKVAALATAFVMKKVLLAALLLFVLFPVVRGLIPNEGRVEGTPASASAVAVAEPVNEEAAVLDPLVPVRERRSVSTAPGATGQVEAADELSGAPLQTIRVVDAVTREVVPGAEVFVVSYRRMREMLRPGSADVLTKDPTVAVRAFLQKRGRRFETDETGSVQVPSPDAGAVA